MADHTAYPDWIDCRDLRAAQEAAGGRGDSAGLSGAGGARVWKSALRLIDPEPDTEAAARSERAAREHARAAAKARAEAAAREKIEALARAKAEAEERARALKEARAREKAEAEARARAEREAREQAAVEARARKLAEVEARRRAEEEARARAAAELQARKDAKARAIAEAKARAEAEERARREAEAAEAAERARAEEEARRIAEARAKAEAEAKQRAEEEARARAAEEARLKKEAEARAKAEAKARAKAEAEEAAAAEQARLEAEVLARATVDVPKVLRRLIRETGPIPLSQYMGESNARYYASRDPLGEQGDFITAPEITQVFGELIGVWLADLWSQMTKRKYIHYVELGPGRGTLAKDALGAAAKQGLKPQIHFVETSATLRKLQREAFPDCIHHHDISTLPDDAPLLIVANEFFDALPVQHLIRSTDGWYGRMVGLEDDAFTFVTGKERMDHLVPPSWVTASQGTLIETSPAAVALMAEIARRLKDQGGAALIIDYGHEELRSGSTLQALKSHQKVDVFAHPGDADLTAHVDFELLQHVAVENGADLMGLQYQGEWLIQMGIDTRMEMLRRRAPYERDKFERQRNRLVKDSEMGRLFKVLGLCGRRWPFGAGFQ